MTMTYQTDPRGRSGRYVPAEKPAPAEQLQSGAFTTEERSDGLHIVERSTGHSFGIAATPEIAVGQIGAAGRMAR